MGAKCRFEKNAIGAVREPHPRPLSETERGDREVAREAMNACGSGAAAVLGGGGTADRGRESSGAMGWKGGCKSDANRQNRV